MQTNYIDWFKLSNSIHLITNKGYRIAKHYDLITSLEEQIQFESTEEYVDKIFPLF